MLPSLKPPTKEIDVDFLVFIQRYATDLLKWDILTFFAHNPDFCATVSQIAKKLGRNTHAIQPDIGDLALLGILEQQTDGNQILYQLTKKSYLRQMTLKFTE